MLRLLLLLLLSGEFGKRPDYNNDGAAVATNLKNSRRGRKMRRQPVSGWRAHIYTHTPNIVAPNGAWRKQWRHDLLQELFVNNCELCKTINVSWCAVCLSASDRKAHRPERNVTEPTLFTLNGTNEQNKYAFRVVFGLCYMNTSMSRPYYEQVWIS